MLTVPCSPLCCSSATDNQALPPAASIPSLIVTANAYLRAIPQAALKRPELWYTRAFQHYAVGHILSFDRLQRPGRHFLCVSAQMQTHFTNTDGDPVCLLLRFTILLFLSFIAPPPTEINGNGFSVLFVFRLCPVEPALELTTGVIFP